MSSRTAAWAGAATLLGLAAAAAETGAAYRPGPHNVVLPPDWARRFVRYAVVDDPDRGIVRHIHVDPQALAALRPGAPAPPGTTLVMADARARRDAGGAPVRDADGRFVAEPGWIAISVQQKQAGWGEGYAPAMRNGEWEYAAFDGAGRRRDVPVASCFACHGQARAAQDFTFTLWDFAPAPGRGR